MLIPGDDLEVLALIEEVVGVVADLDGLVRAVE